MELKNKRILITGGAGFIGRHLYPRLLDGGSEVVILDNLAEQIHGPDALFSDSRVIFHKAEITDAKAVERALVDVDIVFHLASETGTGQSMYEVKRYVDVNELGTAVLLEEIAKQNEKDIHVVLASSRSIYGEGAYISQEGEIVQPSSRTYEQLLESQWELLDDDGASLVPVSTPSKLAPKPGSVYAASKYSQEMLVKVFCSAKNLPCTILRFQNVFGEGQSLRNPYTGIISIFYNRMRQGLPINIFEDGKESRDFVHVSDVVDSLVASITRSKSPVNVVANIGSGEATSVLSLSYLLREVSGYDVPISISGDFRVGDIRHCFADLNCSRKFLNYSPRVGLREGLKRFVDWASIQPEYEDRSESALQEMIEKGMAK